ncbi:MAG: S8 family serine peptidase [Chloroflexota bacterium]|nr:S8 family serine peptidase [Chloroflexota bacterium]
MRKLIAIRKESRLENTTLEAASVEKKRSELVERAQTSERADELVREGFTRIDPPSVANDQYTPLPETQPSFSRLGHLGVYIVNAPSSKWEEEAIEHLQADYDMFDNITLALPSATGTPEMQPTTQPRQSPQWKAESGIPLARAKGLSGYGVIVGVIDTGCNADHDEFSNRDDIDFIYVHPVDPMRTQNNLIAIDADGHGTHVCTTIAGKHFGIAPDIDLMVAAVVTEGNKEST